MCQLHKVIQQEMTRPLLARQRAARLAAAATWLLPTPPGVRHKLSCWHLLLSGSHASSSAGSLPLDTLSRVAYLAVDGSQLTHSGLLMLATVSRVSRHWRAAAAGAVGSFERLQICDDTPLRSPLFQAWAACCGTIGVNACDRLPRTHAFRAFLRDSCPALESLDAGLGEGGDDLSPEDYDMGLLHVAAAWSAVPQLRHLTCDFLPASSVPSGLRTLSVVMQHNEPLQPGKVSGLEVLLVHLQACAELQKVSLTVDSEQLVMRQHVLCHVHLPQVKMWELSLSYTPGQLDLSWLARQRAADVDLTLDRRNANIFGSWVSVLQGLQGVLQPQDTLSIVNAEEKLTVAEQQLLGNLQVFRFWLGGPPQSLLHLPGASRLDIEFGSPRVLRQDEAAVLEFSWSALVQEAGSVVLVSLPAVQEPQRTDKAGWELHLSGDCDLLEDRPRALYLTGFAAVKGRGLVGVRPTAGYTYVVGNKLAAQADWVECPPWRSWT